MPAFDLEGFRTTVPYIHAHRGRTFVLCLESAVLEHAGAGVLLQDIAQLHALGVRIVLVFGARVQLDRELPDSASHDGIRVTRAADMPVVLKTVGAMQAQLQARLSQGLINTPMAGMQLQVRSGNLVAAKPRGVHGGVDFEHTGEVRRVDADAVRTQLQQDALVVLPPLGYSPTGEIFNLNAVDLARTTAQSIAADKLIYLHLETPIRSRRQRATRMTSGDVMKVLKRRKLTAVMRHMLQAAVDVSLSGVSRIHLLEAGRDGALPQELFTREGSGLMITRTEPHTPRQAEVDDIGGIMNLIEPLIQGDALVARTREELELHVHDFRVVEMDGLIVACAGLHKLDEVHAELICLAVHKDYRRNGFGKAVLADTEAHALQGGLQKLCLLTTQATLWFQEQGFQRSQPRSLPVARRHFYNYQRNANVLIKTLEQAHG